MEFQLDVLDILFRAYEKNGNPQRLMELEAQVQNVKDGIADEPPSQELLSRFAKFENEFTVRKILNGVPRPTLQSPLRQSQSLVATQAYQDRLQQSHPPTETSLVSKVKNWCVDELKKLI